MSKDKLLSDEELRVEVDGILNTLGETYDISSAARDVVELINTQKRLYAESVRQEAEVSGKLAAVNHLDSRIFYIEVNPRGEFIKRVINNYRDELSKDYAELRAEQRARIE